MNDLTLSSSALPIQIAKDVRCLIHEPRAGFTPAFFYCDETRLALLARAIFFWRRTMTEFRGNRVTHEYTQTNAAPPAEVFPLLCPVRETDWVPGWQYRMIYSVSGVAEAGCVFATPNENGSETIWIVTEYDPAALRVAFVWVNPGLVAARIKISLVGNSQGTTTRASATPTPGCRTRVIERWSAITRIGSVTKCKAGKGRSITI